MSTNTCVVIVADIRAMNHLNLLLHFTLHKVFEILFLGNISFPILEACLVACLMTYSRMLGLVSSGSRLLSAFSNFMKCLYFSLSSRGKLFLWIRRNIFKYHGVHNPFPGEKIPNSETSTNNIS